jgi:hypothetical protein
MKRAPPINHRIDLPFSLAHRQSRPGSIDPCHSQPPHHRSARELHDPIVLSDTRNMIAANRSRPPPRSEPLMHEPAAKSP